MSILHHPLPFDTLTPESYAQLIKEEIETTRKGLDTLVDSSECTYASILEPLDRILTNISECFDIGQHLESIVGGSQWRTVMTDIRPEITELLTSIPLNQALYERLEELSLERSGLEPAQQRHLDVTLQDFTLKGACLRDTEKRTLKRIELELSDKASKFSQNVIDATESIALDVPVMNLSGVPENIRSQAIERGRSTGKESAVLSGDAVCVNNVLRFAEDRSVREQLWHAFYTRASGGAFDNRRLIEEILNLRKEKASLLGFNNIIELRLKTRMIGNETAANAFLEDLVEAAREQAQSEQDSLCAFSKHHTLLPEGAIIQPWDVKFIAEKQRREVCDFRDERLAPYTTLPALLEGLFKLAKTLFGVEIKPLVNCPSWHEDVRVYGVHESDRLIGVFYADLHPRPGKRSGAWMYPLCHRADDNGVAVGVIAGNLTRGPSYDETALEHREVQTLFHEFGHLMHHLLSEVPIGALSGTNVAWDFVELPSQLLENWVWSPEALKTLFTHKDSLDPIPSRLIKRLLMTRRFRSATGLMRQLSFSILDLELHRLNEPSDANQTALANARKFAPTLLPDHYSMVTTFGHLFSDSVGYSAGYYSYLWSQMLEADVFGRFETEGVFSKETGRAFREKILAVGNSEPPMKAFIAFMGRGPQQEALLARHGLLENSNI